jgi:hypothetical protein
MEEVSHQKHMTLLGAIFTLYKYHATVSVIVTTKFDWNPHAKSKNKRGVSSSLFWIVLGSSLFVLIRPDSSPLWPADARTLLAVYLANHRARHGLIL